MYYPHTWGWSWALALAPLPGLVLPTYVGVILLQLAVLFDISGTTHIRGGDPNRIVLEKDKEPYYPHTWGWSYLSNHFLQALYVLPTYVGVILMFQYSRSIISGTTHIRGGDPNHWYFYDENSKYYPHTWGWSCQSHMWYYGIVVLPTYVGVILLYACCLVIGFSTTHIRGGDPACIGRW